MTARFPPPQQSAPLPAATQSPGPTLHALLSGPHSRLRELWLLLGAVDAIDATDMRLMLITDDLDEMVRYLEHDAVQRFRLRAGARPKARRWLGERPVTA